MRAWTQPGLNPTIVLLQRQSRGIGGAETLPAGWEPQLPTLEAAATLLFPTASYLLLPAPVLGLQARQALMAGGCLEELGFVLLVVAGGGG